LGRGLPSRLALEQKQRLTCDVWGGAGRHTGHPAELPPPVSVLIATSSQLAALIRAFAWSPAALQPIAPAPIVQPQRRRNACPTGSIPIALSPLLRLGAVFSSTAM